MDSPESKRSFPEDDVLVANLYEVSKEVDRILNRIPMEDHAAVMGMIQVSCQRRAHEHQQRNQRKMQEAQEEMQRRQRVQVQ